MKRLLVLFAASAAIAAAQTKVPDSMIAHPPVQFTAIQILTSGGPILVQLDPATITIDNSGAVPVLKAVQPTQPTYGQRSEYFNVADAPKQSFPLATTPAPSYGIPKVYRNGLRMTPGIDYAFNNGAITFVSAQTILAGDLVVVDYWVAQ